MLFSPNNDQPFGDQYYSMLGDEDINPPKHHMAATSPDFFALSPLSTDQSCRNHELLHHEELNPFPPTTNGPPDVDCSRGGCLPSKHANIDDDRYNPNNTAGGQDHELLAEKGGPRNVGSSSGGKQKRTRVVKKDRHSKIVTAHGPRDRRMRLSLEVARKFFDLQDMLGYDKASKTVEWLMTKSRPAIKSLTRSDAKAASSTSECEVTSWVVEDDADDNTIAASSPHQSNLKKPAATRPKKKKKAAARVVPVRKPATQAREWRAMARARARERTWEKLCSRKNMDGSSSPVEESGSREVGPLEEPSSLSFPAADAMADDSCPPQIFAVSCSHGLNTVSNNSLQSHEMIEYYIQQNWEAGDASASLLHVPAAIGPHGGEGTYMSFVRPLPGFRPAVETVDAQTLIG